VDIGVGPGFHDSQHQVYYSQQYRQEYQHLPLAIASPSHEMSRTTNKHRPQHQPTFSANADKTQEQEAVEALNQEDVSLVDAYQTWDFKWIVAFTGSVISASVLTFNTVCNEPMPLLSFATDLKVMLVYSCCIGTLCFLTRRNRYRSCLLITGGVVATACVSGLGISTRELTMVVIPWIINIALFLSTLVHIGLGRLRRHRGWFHRSRPGSFRERSRICSGQKV
jgi:hypothetical protein